MKKLLALLCVLSLALSIAACGKGSSSNPPAGDPDNVQTNGQGEIVTDAQGNVIPSNSPMAAVTDMPETFNDKEFILYDNIFYNNMGEQFNGKDQIKQGNFAILRDEYNQKDRYYVWGYADQTRCCDFQWEFVPSDVSALPNPGSRIEVRGTFTQSTDALDGYWLTNTTVDVLEDYGAPEYDYDLTRCSPTLARVQIQNMQSHTDAFNGKTMRVFGRALNANCIQHPYYNEAWTMDFKDAAGAPAVGIYILLGGTFEAADAEGSFLTVSDYKEV